MLNKVCLIGNCGNDPEIRYTQDNRAIANLSLATSEKWTDKSGQKQEQTEWHRVVVFGGLADVVQKYVKRGDKLYIEGKLQTRKWQDKDGQDKYTTEVVVNGFGGTVHMLGNKGSTSAPETTQEPPQTPQVTQEEDDVPF